MSHKTPKLLANFKFWLHRVDKTTGETPKGYIVESRFYKKKVEELTVTITDELMTKRSSGEYTYLNYEFADYKTLSRVLEGGVGEGFGYLAGSKGKCVSGDCKNGMGTMKFDQASYLGPATFEGSFNSGEPVRGRVVLQSAEYGKIELVNIGVEDGLLAGTTEAILSNGDRPLFYYSYGNVVAVENLDRGEYVYSGSVTGSLRPKHGGLKSKYVFDRGHTVWVSKNNNGQLSGIIEYPTGFRYEGLINPSFQCHGYGSLYDGNGGKLTSTFAFNATSSNYWTFDNGVWRRASADPFIGYSGSVKTYFETWYSKYTIAGEFYRNKPTGYHRVTEETTGDIVASATYENGKLVKGDALYEGDQNIIDELIEADDEIEREFSKYIAQLVEDSRNQGENVLYSTMTYLYNNETKKVDFNDLKERDLHFLIYDPHSNADSYTLKVSASLGLFDVSDYDDIILKRDLVTPEFYTSSNGINTTRFDDVSLEVSPSGAGKNKFKSAIIVLID
ncbi:MAG: hypothetical protein JXR19_03335 [Bacteroidia bacterium]